MLPPVPSKNGGVGIDLHTQCARFFFLQWRKVTEVLIGWRARESNTAALRVKKKRKTLPASETEKEGEKKNGRFGQACVLFKEKYYGARTRRNI